MNDRVEKALRREPALTSDAFPFHRRDSTSTDDVIDLSNH